MRDVFMKFTRLDGSHYWVSVWEYYRSDPDSYQDEVDEHNLYQWRDIGRGWQYVPIT